MSQFAAFARLTGIAAADAARTYFEPLSKLAARLSQMAERDVPTTEPPFARPSVMHFWRATNRWSRQLRIARQLGESDVVESVLAETELRLEELGHLRRSVDIEYREMASRWSNHGAADDSKLSFHYQSSTATSLKVASWLVILFEGILAATFGWLFLGIEPMAAVVIGLVVAVCIAVGATAIADLVVVSRYETRPDIAREMLVRLVMICGAIWLAGLSALFLARTVSTTAAIGPIPTPSALGPILGMLSVVTPVLAGLLRAAAHLMGWPGELNRKAQELTELHLRTELTRSEAIRLRDTISKTRRPSVGPFDRPMRAINLEG